MNHNRALSITAEAHNSAESWIPAVTVAMQVYSKPADGCDDREVLKTYISHIASVNVITSCHHGTAAQTVLQPCV